MEPAAGQNQKRGLTVGNSSSKRQHPIRTTRESALFGGHWRRRSGFVGPAGAGGLDCCYCGPYCRAVRRIHILGRLCRPVGQWRHDDSPGHPRRSDRSRLRAHHGHFRGFHCGMRRRSRPGRPLHDGKPHRHIFPFSVPARVAPFPSAADIHAYRGRHRDHVDRGHGYATRIQCVRGYSPRAPHWLPHRWLRSLPCLLSRRSYCVPRRHGGCGRP